MIFQICVSRETKLEPKWQGHFGNYVNNTLLALHKLRAKNKKSHPTPFVGEIPKFVDELLDKPSKSRTDFADHHSPYLATVISHGGPGS